MNRSRSSYVIYHIRVINLNSSCSPIMLISIVISVYSQSFKIKTKEFRRFWWSHNFVLPTTFSILLISTVFFCLFKMKLTNFDDFDFHISSSCRNPTEGNTKVSSDSDEGCGGYLLDNNLKNLSTAELSTMVQDLNLQLQG